jgi:hypothetical protein
MPLHPSHLPNVRTFLANLTRAYDHHEVVNVSGGSFEGSELHSVRMALEQAVRDCEKQTQQNTPCAPSPTC